MGKQRTRCDACNIDHKLCTGGRPICDDCSRKRRPCTWDGADASAAAAAKKKADRNARIAARRASRKLALLAPAGPSATALALAPASVPAPAPTEVEDFGALGSAQQADMTLTASPTLPGTLAPLKDDLFEDLKQFFWTHKAPTIDSDQLERRLSILVSLVKEQWREPSDDEDVYGYERIIEHWEHEMDALDIVLDEVIYAIACSCVQDQEVSSLLKEDFQANVWYPDYKPLLRSAFMDAGYPETTMPSTIEKFARWLDTCNLDGIESMEDQFFLRALAYAYQINGQIVESEQNLMDRLGEEAGQRAWEVLLELQASGAIFDDQVGEGSSDGLWGV